MSDVYPQLYALPTDDNERLLSVLSAVTFRTANRPSFTRAAKHMLPHSLEVLQPLRLTKQATPSPILLVILMTPKTAKTMQYFVHLAQQSPAFIVFPHVLTDDDGSAGNSPQANKLAQLSANSGLSSFVIVFGDEATVKSKSWSQFWYDLDSLVGQNRKRTDSTTLSGIISVNQLDLGMSLASAVPHLRIQMGDSALASSVQASGYWRNPNVILMLVPHMQRSTAAVWVARLLFKFVFAVLQFPERNQAVSRL